jgi:hypothetical protein
MDIWLVWNSSKKGEAVAFDNYNDAHQTAYGEFQQMAPAIGEEFFKMYEENAPLPIDRIELDAENVS